VLGSVACWFVQMRVEYSVVVSRSSEAALVVFRSSGVAVPAAAIAISCLCARERLHIPGVFTAGDAHTGHPDPGSSLFIFFVFASVMWGRLQ
jgi:hypothetical protein